MSAVGAIGVAGCSPVARRASVARPGPASSRPASPSAVASSSPAALESQLRGRLLLPGSADYASAARLFDARFDSSARPAAIAQCVDAGDVVACVRHVAEAGTPFALRSGGHSYGGWSTSTGLVIDVRGLDSVTVDTAAMTARIGAGAGLASVYAALAAKGVALAAGSCPTVGVAGLTMGGGVGVLARAFGLTCDAVRSVDIVTADGELRTVSATADADLFWALRGGGGGSFGAVTSLTFAVRPAPTVSLFYLRWDIGHGEAVLDAWQRLMLAAPDELWSTAKLLADPGSGGAVAIVAGTWIGPPAALTAQLAPFLAQVGAPPASRSMSTLGYLPAMLAEGECGTRTAAECAAAALTPAERLPFSAASSIVGEPLSGSGIAAAVEVARAALEVPHLVEGGMSFDALGGAVARVGVADSAFAWRQALATVQYSATWSGSRPVTPYDAYVRSARGRLLPFTGDTAYVNYADPSLTNYPSAYWGVNASRLRQVKRAYDPHGLFTFPQVVRA